MLVTPKKKTGTLMSITLKTSMPVGVITADEALVDTRQVMVALVGLGQEDAQNDVAGLVNFLARTGHAAGLQVGGGRLQTRTTVSTHVAERR